MKTSETYLCWVVGNSAKKGWVKLIPLTAESFWGDIGAYYNSEVGDTFQHLGLYRLSLQNSAGLGKPPRYFVNSAELLLKFDDLVSQYQ
jgi:hypothetical protein